MEPKQQIKEYLLQGLNQLGLEPSTLPIDNLIAYFELLLAANNSVNLISSKQDLKTQVAVHLLDSLSPLLWDNWPELISCLDIGSGGGLPAIPLALAFPDWEFVLAEATGKKILFLSGIIDKLNLPKVKVLNKFLEPDKNPEGQKFDLISARGVSDISKLSALAGPRLKSGGLLLAFKGPQAANELLEAESKLKKWHLKLYDQIDFSLPLVQANRTLLLLMKD